MVAISLSFVYLRMSLISPQFIKDNFVGYRRLVYSCFSFSILNMSTHCLLASMFSNKKSVGNLIGNPLHVMSHFLLAVFNILSMFFGF